MIKLSKTNISIIVFSIFVAISLIFNYKAGLSIGINFLSFIQHMGLMLPPVFILLSLFEVWVKKETVEKHLGDNSGAKSYFYMIILASTMVGGIIVSLPVAITLASKGAKSSYIYTFIFASSICRIPMTFFESSFMGIKFSIIRLIVSIPLVIILSMMIEKFFGHINIEDNLSDH